MALRYLSFYSRFLANEFGLAGANNMERAEADEAVDALSIIKFIKNFFQYRVGNPQ